MRDALAGDGRADAATPDFVPLRGPLARADRCPSRSPSRCGALRPTASRWTSPGSTRCSSTSTGCPGRAARPAGRDAAAAAGAVAAPGPRPGDVAVVPAAPRDAAGLTVLYPWSTRRTGFRRCPASRLCSSTTSSPGRWRRRAAWVGCSRRSPRGRRRFTGTPATCLAVDPDLVATAAAMRQGYAVRGPTGTVPGTGAEVAGTWLDTLAAAARDGCVVALPFADADLVALARGQLADLGSMAVADAGAVVTEAIGTPVLEATTWPSGGVLDEPALDAVAAGGARAVVLDAAAVDGGATGETGGAVPSRRRHVVAARGAHRPPGPRGGRTGRPHPRRRRCRRDGSGGDEPAAGHPGRGGHPRVPFPGCGRAAGRRRSAARVEHGRDRGPRAARRRGPAARLGPDAGPRPRRRRRRRTHDAGRGSAPGRPAAGRQPRHPARGAGVRPRDARGRARPALGRRARHRGRRTVDATFDPLLQAAVRPTSATWHGRPDLARSTASAAATRIGELRDSIRVLAAQPVLAGDLRCAAAADRRERAARDDGGAGEHLQHHGPADRADPAAAHPAAGPAAGAGQRGGRAVGAVLGGRPCTARRAARSARRAACRCAPPPTARSRCG